MKEDIERRTVAVSITATKLTAKTLAKALAALVRKIQKEHQKAQAPQGRQSVAKLMNHRVNTNALPLDGDTRLFDRVACQFNVDYAFHKTGPKKYLLLFKSGQADAITACFSEYTKRVMAQAHDKRPRIMEQLKSFGNACACYVIKSGWKKPPSTTWCRCCQGTVKSIMQYVFPGKNCNIDIVESFATDGTDCVFSVWYTDK